MQIIFEIYFFHKEGIMIFHSAVMRFVRVNCLKNNYKMYCIVNVMQVIMHNEFVN